MFKMQIIIFRIETKKLTYCCHGIIHTVESIRELWGFGMITLHGNYNMGIYCKSYNGRKVRVKIGQFITE